MLNFAINGSMIKGCLRVISFRGIDNSAFFSFTLKGLKQASNYQVGYGCKTARKGRGEMQPYRIYLIVADE